MTYLKQWGALWAFCLVVAAAGTVGGCTAQERARSYGGDATITLDTGNKLEMITWKEGAELWYLTRLRRPGEVPETHVFHQERALWGTNGTVTIVER